MVDISTIEVTTNQMNPMTNIATAISDATPKNNLAFLDISVTTAALCDWG